MKYSVSVFVGAASYGVLSTIVVLAYQSGFQLGEIVGTQLLTGVLLSWLSVFYIQKRKSAKTDGGRGNQGDDSSYTSLTWRQRGLLMLAGAPTVITGLLYYQSLRYIPASLAIILLFQFTWIGVAIQAVLTCRRPGKNMLLALLVILAGTLLAAGVLGEAAVPFDRWGILFGLLAAVSYSCFILFSGRVVSSAHPISRSAWMVTGGFILLAILFPPYFLFNGSLWGPLLLFGALLGFFGAFLPPLLFAIGVPHVGEGMAGILGAAELPVAVLMSSLVLHEPVGEVRWLGVALILAGVALPELRKLRKRSNSSLAS
ncbi:EamA family transporter [Propionispora vibrioides]|uniref:Threonine/homoserine efflux transporter RhtA n=1 Tax=Propionispora vibrioides TaxID=112903 RepID=A0A1H8XYP4_9FIRM|nr:EamA family transporter [Propionispora vibrioides]SEP44999.1 Threonine/homoserine efflux transporter RhtA [Propionispora vibrioides]